MTESTGRRDEIAALAPTPQESALARAAAAWVGQFARTLKTCRLYDGNNPTVIKFREDLAVSLSQLLAEHGPLTLSFTAVDVLLGEVSLYPARSRDDSLGLPFYRDGIRSLTFSPGIEPREVEAFLDLVLKVTSRVTNTDDDLVTLLWDAEMVHVDMNYVSPEADVEGGGGESEAAACPIPWPGSQPGQTAEAGGATPASDSAEGASETETRSEDWQGEELPAGTEAILDELEARGAREVERFRAEYEIETATASVSAAVALVAKCVSTASTDDDRAEMARFLARLLREAIALGDWRDALQASALMDACACPEFTTEGFLRDLAHPDSVVTASCVTQLDHQTTQGIQEFITLGRAFGSSACEWLMLVLAESQQQRTRRLLARAIADLCRDNPERLAPWLRDPRWYVVRNVVHILGWIGGAPIAGLLRSARGHGERRVRLEVVAALAQVAPETSRPVLMEMLEDTDSRVFGAAVHQLAERRDPEFARAMADRLRDPEFAERSPEERRTIYSALGASGGDEVLPALEEEMLSRKWFSKEHAAHIQAVARCIARIGTPAARATLERGKVAGSGPARAICGELLEGMRSDD